MRRDLEAAQRLASMLPVRTHFCRDDGESNHWRQIQKANHTRAVRVNGVIYDSLTEAGRQLGCCRDKIRNMIRAGAAAYVKEGK